MRREGSRPLLTARPAAALGALTVLDASLRAPGPARDRRAALAAVQSPELAEGEPLTIGTSAGRLRLVPKPWGTRGYDDFRIRSNRENLGRGLRPKIAATVDLVRMLEASTRARDLERLQRLRRVMELERVRTRRRGLYIER